MRDRLLDENHETYRLTGTQVQDFITYIEMFEFNFTLLKVMQLPCIC